MKIHIKLFRCEIFIYRDVKLVKLLPDCSIYVDMEKQHKGIFDLKLYFDKGVFKELQNIHYFQSSWHYVWYSGMVT